MYKFQYYLLSQNLRSEHMHIKLEEERDDEFLILPLANFSFSLCELTSRGTYHASNRNTQNFVAYFLPINYKQSEDYDVYLSRHVVWNIHRDIVTV
jgi:hypothetical protein